MNAHSKIHQAHLDEWSARFADQAASGLTVRDWCAKHNLSIHKYNYWKHQLKESLADQVLPDIVPVMYSGFASPVSCNSLNSHESAESRNSSNFLAPNTSAHQISVTVCDVRIEIASSEISLLPDIIKAVRSA